MFDEIDATYAEIVSGFPIELRRNIAGMQFAERALGALHEGETEHSIAMASCAVYADRRWLPFRNRIAVAQLAHLARVN